MEITIYTVQDMAKPLGLVVEEDHRGGVEGYRLVDPMTGDTSVKGGDSSMSIEEAYGKLQNLAKARRRGKRTEPTIIGNHPAPGHEIVRVDPWVIAAFGVVAAAGLIALSVLTWLPPVS